MAVYGWALARVAPLPYKELNEEDHEIINGMRETLLKEIPCWKTTLSLPINILRLKGNILSSSATSIPQHMFLSNSAITNEHLLSECYIHELSHLWLTCYAEIYDLQKISRRHHTLPSGTPNKDARGVIYAAFFAASVLYYLNATGQRPRRVSELNLYLEACLSTLTKHQEEVSPLGCQLIQQIVEFQQ